jgi:hypothetical protein
MLRALRNEIVESMAGKAYLITLENFAARVYEADSAAL